MTGQSCRVYSLKLCFVTFLVCKFFLLSFLTMLMTAVSGTSGLPSAEFHVGTIIGIEMQKEVFTP
jgi:hypothetical protein